LPLIRRSKNTEPAEEKIADQFELKPSHMRALIDMEISEISSVDFSSLPNILLIQRTVYQTILDKYYEDSILN
jgi:hypothetical protein